MSFVPDLRNLGGQGALTNLMTNHYASLFNAKPVVNSRQPVLKSGAKKRKQIPDLFENLVAMKKVEKVKAYTDHAKPETIDMAKQLSDYKIRKKKSKQDPHPKTMQNMQRRIDSYNLLRERKKNEFDYKTNPVVLFRNNSEEKHENVVVRNRKDGDIFSLLKKGVKKAKGQEKEMKVKRNDFKETLLEEIVERNIWTDEDLDALFDRTREQNQDWEKEVEEAIEYVKKTIM
ncbi:hypothetical protein SteCoe_8083 [Stentor coeruleus]|uniref:Uncharacterized protein n=1 Tax=Stentor coeruleus TaxID=5963 RepID=A0A1R2CL23_9CILI|nr:hypothetical protein SteCoe_8083 [Stentor coeruleus]